MIRLDEHHVVKSGPFFDSSEIEAMSFIAAHTTIPVPRTYDIYIDGKHGKRHIVMDYMRGQPLDKV